MWIEATWCGGSVSQIECSKATEWLFGATRSAASYESRHLVNQNKRAMLRSNSAGQPRSKPGRLGVTIKRLRVINGINYVCVRRRYLTRKWASRNATQPQRVGELLLSCSPRTYCCCCCCISRWLQKLSTTTDDVRLTSHSLMTRED